VLGGSLLLPTPSMEDYLEKVYLLIKEKGYARTVEIAESLSVNPSSVTKMLQKLDELEYVIYEKYRGISLTKKGEKYAKTLAEKHQVLEQFLRDIGVSEELIYDDVEGIEHHVSKQTLSRISSLVNFFEEHPEFKASYLKYLKESEN
jgi:Mn-dependent DtxR family transcriptional regulator